MIYRGISSLLRGNWDLTPKEQSLQNLALTFSSQELLPESNNWDHSQIFPAAQLKASASLGFGGLYCSSSSGGTSLTRLESSLILECLSKGCISFAVYTSTHNIVSWMLDTFGSAYLKSKYLPSLYAYDLFIAYCLTEPGSGSDAASLQTTAQEDGEDYLINGCKSFVTAGPVADLLAVVCKTGPKEFSLFLVDSSTDGIGFGGTDEKMGWRALPSCEVTFSNVRVSARNRVGGRGEGLRIALQGLEGGRINISACALGGAWFAVEAAAEEVRQREQVRGEVGSGQYVRYEMAEWWMRLVAARVVVRHAASMIDQGNREKITIAAMAKMFATDCCFDIVDEILKMQVGELKERGIERVWRELRVLQIVEGTNEIMKLLISRELFGKN